MSPFKRIRSPYWQVWPRVTGHGRVGPYSTKTKDHACALAMERVIKELPLRGHDQLITMLTTGRTSVAEIYVHHVSGKLHELAARMSDPKISEAVDALVPQVKDDRVRSGLQKLLELCPAGARLSYLREPKTIEDVLHARERQGIRRNSVRRSLYRAISDLLDRELGGAIKTGIMGEVRYPAEKDERETKLRPDQIAKVLDSVIDPLFECMVGLAVTSGIDRAPLLAIQPQHFDERTGVLDVIDTKTSARPRAIELPTVAASYLRRAILLRAAGPEERVFPWTRHQVRRYWDATRERAQMPWLRFKDLRSVFSTYFVSADGALKDLQTVLGHASGKTSLRYTKNQPIRQRQTMERAAELMGFTKQHLKVEN